MKNRRNTTQSSNPSSPHHAPNDTTHNNPPRERHTPMAQSFAATLDEFLDTTVDPGGDALPTKIELVPECETRATVQGINLRKFQNDDNEWRAIVEVMFSCNDPAIKEETGLDDPRVRYTMFLDVMKNWDGNGNPPLEFGRNKNVQLARLLEGFGMNDGRKFKWSSLIHEDAWVRVVKPRNLDQAMFSDVAAIGQDQTSVTRPAKQRRAA